MFESFSLAANLGFFVAAAAVVWAAGTRIARYANAIAETTGIGREVLGVILLGGVTSLPEMAVASTAPRRLPRRRVGHRPLAKPASVDPGREAAPAAMERARA